MERETETGMNKYGKRWRKGKNKRRTKAGKRERDIKKETVAKKHGDKGKEKEGRI